MGEKRRRLGLQGLRCGGGEASSASLYEREGAATSVCPQVEVTDRSEEGVSGGISARPSLC
jgi:hypothetical protein